MEAVSMRNMHRINSSAKQFNFCIHQPIELESLIWRILGYATYADIPENIRFLLRPSSSVRRPVPFFFDTGYKTATSVQNQC